MIVMKIEVEKGLFFWHWRIRARNGEIIASSETYSSKSAAIKTAQKVATSFGVSLDIND
jgi:uncharacterized protein YegP (UPF0339 family)